MRLEKGAQSSDVELAVAARDFFGTLRAERREDLVHLHREVGASRERGFDAGVASLPRGYDGITDSLGASDIPSNAEWE